MFALGSALPLRNVPARQMTCGNRTLHVVGIEQKMLVDLVSDGCRLGWAGDRRERVDAADRLAVLPLLQSPSRR